MSCELSPSASAFSTVLSAFIGSVLNGLFSGFWIAFFTGWISWLAFIRILAAGVYEVYLTFRAGANFNMVHDDQYQSLKMATFHGSDSQTAGSSIGNQHTTEGGDEEARLTQPAIAAQAQSSANYSTGVVSESHEPKPTGMRARGTLAMQPQRTVTTFGWLGWAWSAVYTPITQSIWLYVNFNSGNGASQLVRALAISVSALGLTFDYKQRYAASIGRRWGAWAFVGFNVWNSVACLLLGLESTILLVRGALNIDSIPVFVYVIIPLFSIVWAAMSWKILPPIDGARPGFNIFADVLMGAFAGLFVAAPAFVLWQSEKFERDHMNFGTSKSSGMDLGEFLSCESATILEKFAAVMP
jgi:hypothetical protein